MQVTPLGQHLGARIAGADLAAGLDDAGFRAIEEAFHRHAVIAISDQRLDETALIEFSRRFGKLELNVASSFHHRDFPYINVLSNKRKPDGAPLGSADAGARLDPLCARSADARRRGARRHAVRRHGSRL
jgi:taurine dioxygenase